MAVLTCNSFQDHAAFFDRIGIFVFLFIILDAIYDLRKKQPTWRVWLRLIIGIAGLIVDGALVAFDVLT